MRSSLRDAIRFSPNTARDITQLDRTRLMFRLRTTVERELSSKGNAYAILNPIRSVGVDRFGLSSTERLRRAKTRFLKQIDNSLKKSVARKEPVGFAIQSVQEVIDNQSSFRGLIAYEVARADNLARFEQWLTKGASFIEIRLSPSHRDTDICNELVGRKPAKLHNIPPFHSYCKCYVLMNG